MMQTCVTDALSLAEQKLLAEYLYDPTKFRPQSAEVQAQFADMNLGDLLGSDLERNFNNLHLDEGQQPNIDRETERAATSHRVSVHAALHYTATQAEQSLKKAPKTRRDMLSRPDAAAFLKAELEHLTKIGPQGLQSFEVISKSLLPQGSRPMRNR